MSGHSIAWNIKNTNPDFILNFQKKHGLSLYILHSFRESLNARNYLKFWAYQRFIPAIFLIINMSVGVRRPREFFLHTKLSAFNVFNTPSETLVWIKVNHGKFPRLLCTRLLHFVENVYSFCVLQLKMVVSNSSAICAMPLFSLRIYYIRII